MVAKVNGEEITRAELSEEARARGVRLGSDLSLRNKLLADIIDRKLLVQKAIAAKLDETPAHILAKRRTTEILLAQQLIASTPDPSPPEQSADLTKSDAGHATNSASSNPNILISVDRIVYARDLPRGVEAALKRTNDIDAIADLLKRSEMKLVRGFEVIDSREADPSLVARIRSAGVGGTVRFPSDTSETAIRILAISHVPHKDDDNLLESQNRLLQERTSRVLNALIQEGMRDARIEYQKGYRTTGTNGSISKRR